MKLLLIILALLFALHIAILVLKKLGYQITYAISHSMPQGWYLVVPLKNLQRGDIAVFVPPESTKLFLTQQHWGAENNQLLKYVMGIPGDFVCNKQRTIWINHKEIAPVLIFYAPGNKLPQSNFCGRLNQEQYILLSTKIERSFDSRYFGPVKRDNIIGKAIPFYIQQFFI